MNKCRRAGFTLVEVLTVIAIIALLAALILGLASNAQRSAGRKKAEAEVAQIQSFVTDYQMQYGQVPKTPEALKLALVAANHSISNMVDPWGISYMYSNPPSSKVVFYVWSRGGSTETDPTKDNREAYIGNPPPK